jgi:anaerobic dimethyl sulfoxide reductase subunit C (anchor subunit)
MNTREWALVAFTLLMQTSVGVLLVVAALQPLVSRGSAHGPARPFDLPLLVASGAAILGLLASLVHLGQPAQAWLALTNLRSSWLSREVLLAVLFAAAAGSFTALVRTGSGSLTVRNLVCALAVIVGVASVFAMSRLYLVPAQPAWNRLATPITFFATTVLLGIVVVVVMPAAGATHAAPLPEPVGEELTRWVILIAIGLIAMQLLLLPAQLAALAREPAAAISAVSVGEAAWLAAGRALAAIAALVLLVFMLRGMPGANLPAGAHIALLALVFASELLGRVLFYASAVRLGPV